MFDGQMIGGEAGDQAGPVLGEAALKIVGVANVEKPSAAMEHVSPEGHRLGLGQGRFFDKLRMGGIVDRHRGILPKPVHPALVEGPHFTCA